MQFDASTCKDIEDFLSDYFEFHNDLDAFLLRSGIPNDIIQTVRLLAEQQAKSSTRNYSRAPKRFVCSNLLNTLSNAKTPNGQNHIAALITNIARVQRSSIHNTSALSAHTNLLTRIASDKKTKSEIQKEKSYHESRQKINQEQERLNTLILQTQRDALTENFNNLIYTENHQERGFLLEKFLNDFFKTEGLDPRQSFRINGEQIDGSFQAGNQTHLVEAKWVKEPVSGKEFGAFLYKVQGKSVDTRGLFISINGFSQNAVNNLCSKGTLQFVCIDGAHLLRALAVGQSFQEILQRIWRHASETGSPYLPVSEF